jgi:hypothetical protein
MKMQDTPAGIKFAQTLAVAVDDLSFSYSFTPDSAAGEHLESFLQSIRPAMEEAVGASNAPMWLDAFRSKVLTRKWDLENSCVSRMIH